MFEILVIAFGLGLDAFSLAVAFGMCQKVCTLNTRFRLSLSFGLFQFFMPLAGFYAGLKVARFTESIDHWIVFAILSFVGGKMIYEALSKDDNETMVDISRGIPLLIASVATSIDALAVGFSFALLKDGILFPAIIIGIVASIMTFVGVTFGYRVGRKYISKPEVVGGIAIVLIGFKALLEHFIS
ncbi:MAG: manganese efflux pump MntP family protein [Atribacterota bacterium]|uniref:Putative manganese efflux pump MntP n=1 Tax=Atribacter laminatus TaxID=2847778 RepID=A0A7T1ALG1_ATRLM|nr:manganese efflux pump MntP family protein [Atribacter laminatus]MDI9594478.1 manganese efflux pump MntP family protein [Atribacterota bacterium]QPM68091.1 putative manganese efflux pump MntP [Atribacter laminatus]